MLESNYVSKHGEWDETKAAGYLWPCPSVVFVQSNTEAWSLSDVRKFRLPGTDDKVDTWHGG